MWSTGSIHENVLLSSSSEIFIRRPISRFKTIILVLWLIHFVCEWRSHAQSLIFDLELVERLLNTTNPARIVVPPMNITVPLNEYAVFTCRAQGHPKPTMRFKFNGETITSHMPRVKTSSTDTSALLEVHSTLSMNGARVECLAENQEVATALAFLSVLSDEDIPSGFPRILKAPSREVFLDTGRNTIFECEILADPAARIGWIINMTELIPDEVRVKLRDTGSLEILSVMHNDQGTYRCFGHNSKGMVVSTSSQVTVRAIMSPPVFTASTVTSVETERGKVVNLTCEAYGHPTPETWWESTKERQLTSRKPMFSILHLTDLSETSAYLCKAQNRLGQVSRRVTVVVKDLPQPPKDLEIRSKGPTSALLRWRASSAQVFSYTLSIYVNHSSVLSRRQYPNIVPGKSGSFPMPSGSSPWITYNITDLEPFTSYVASIHAINSAGMSPPSEPMDFMTEEAAPEEPPRSVYANVTSFTSVLVSWKPPLKENGPIIAYRVYYSEHVDISIDQWMIETSTDGRQEVLLRNLKPNATYFIKVVAENRAGRSPLSAPFPIVVRPGVTSAPSSPTNFRGVHMPDGSIRLAWDKPELSEGIPLKGYVLRYKLSSDGNNEPIEEQLAAAITSHVIRPVRPNSTYAVELAAITRHGRGAAAIILVKTESSELPSPSSGVAEAMQNAQLKLTWLMPARKLPYTFSKFRIGWKRTEDPRSRSWGSLDYAPANILLSKHEYILQDLDPYTSYTMNVSTVYQDGFIGGTFTYPSLTTTGKLPPRPEGLRVRMVEYKYLGMTEMESVEQYVYMEVEWKPPRVSSKASLNQITGYQIRFYPSSRLSSTEENLRFRSGLGILRRFIRSFLSSPSSEGVVVRNISGTQYVTDPKTRLSFARLYLIELAAMNAAGIGEPANVTVNTPEGRPGPIQQIQATMLNNSSTHLVWYPPAPEHCNGKITGYEVEYCMLRHVIFHSVKLSNSNPTIPTSEECESKYSANTTGSSISFHRMQLGRRFRFRVRAYTKAGPGEYTPSSPVRSGTEKPGAPTNIKWTRLNPNQIKVNWNFPQSSAHQVIYGFQIAYAPQDNSAVNQWSETDVGPVTVAVVSDVQPYKFNYSVRVRARAVPLYATRDEESFGDWSVFANFSTSYLGFEDGRQPSRHAVRNLRCVPGILFNQPLAKLTVTWQSPIVDKNLAHFTLQLNGSKSYFDESRKLKSHMFMSEKIQCNITNRQSVDHIREFNSQIEPNTEFDIVVRSVYLMSGGLNAFEGEKTSCVTRFIRPDNVSSPLILRVDQSTKRVRLRCFPCSERLGAIEWYYLIVIPAFKADRTPPHSLNIDDLLREAIQRESHVGPYVVGKWNSLFYNKTVTKDGDATSSADIILGGGGEMRFRANIMASEKGFVLLDNKPLTGGQDYRAAVRACVFKTVSPFSSIDNGQDPLLCATSGWSNIFNTEKPVYYDVEKETARLNFAGFDLVTVIIAALLAFLAMLAFLCIGVGCYTRRRKPKLHHEVMCTESSLKQPLMSREGKGGASRTAHALNFYETDGGASDVVAKNSKANGGTTKAPHSKVTSSPKKAQDNGLAVESDQPIVNSPTNLSANSLNHPSLDRSNEAVVHNSQTDNDKFNGVNIELATINGRHSTEVGGPSRSNVMTPCSVREAYEKQHFSTSPINGYAVNGHALSPLSLANGIASSGDIYTSELADHIVELRANDNLKFSQEYESIDPAQEFTWEHSSLDINKSKNRYANVISYDHSRVILQQLEGIPGSTYINASWMDGYRKNGAYIAAQGPLVETIGDFWRMVWELRCSGIVMMTRLEERSRVKCDQYWPSKGSLTYPCGSIASLQHKPGYSHQHHTHSSLHSNVSVQVTLLEVTEMAYYVIRRLRVRMCGASGGAQLSREISQYQFTAWPDHGVPDSPIPLLLFMRRVRGDMQFASKQQHSFHSPPCDSQAAYQESPFHSKSHSSHKQGPLLVHCSAGVGRTGAYIVIDIQLDRMEHGENTVNIYNTVTGLRSQRNYMVQTEEQYVFIYDALLDVVQYPSTDIPVHLLQKHVSKLSIYDPELGSTRMEMEFKKVSSYRLYNARHTSAHLPVNRLKNRFMHILPYETTRVCLQPLRGIEGSDYINASHVDGFTKRRAYIAAQGPLPETTEDFWRMLWEQESTVVVMLTELRETGKDKCHPYWPSERSARYQYFVVDPMVEYNMPTYILREFKVTDARDAQSRTLRQFQFTQWPLTNPMASSSSRASSGMHRDMVLGDDVNAILSCADSLVDFIGQVHKAKEQFGQEGPITVHCSAGVGRTGVFLALSIALERLRYESSVDLYQIIRLLRTQRPSMVQSEVQYQLCYAGVQQYLTSFEQFIS